MPFDQQGYALNNIATTSVVSGDENPVWIYAGLFLLLAIWGISIAVFGLPGLYIPAVIATPVVLVAIIRITLG